MLRTYVPRARPEHEPLLGRLVRALERHTLALTIAGGSLEQQAYERWPTTVTAIERQVREGLAFGELGQEGDQDERDVAVEASLRVAYGDLDEVGRARFRTLGAFAPAATFDGVIAAAAWGCEDTEDGWRTLDDLARRGLVTRIEEDGPTRWQQHGVVRWYALALLDVTGESDAAARQHAETCVALLRSVEQREHLVLPEYAQISHAFAWAVEHDLVLAQVIAARSFDLQDRFGLNRDAHGWAERYLEAARHAEDEARIAAAWGTLGNAGARLANLGGEDRGARLREALAAYDQALRFYTPEAAPLDYAATQNNRGAVLRDLATLGEEDRGARLREALAAYDQALRFYTPEAAPLDYAMTQGNRTSLFMDLATMPGEDRLARLSEALGCVVEALGIFVQVQHTPYVQQAARLLVLVRDAAGDEFPALWREVTGSDEAPGWLADPS